MYSIKSLVNLDRKKERFSERERERERLEITRL